MKEIRRGAHPMAWMTWIMMLVAQLFFLALAYNRIPTGPNARVAPVTDFVYLLAGLAAVAAIASLAIRNTRLIRPAQRGELVLNTLEGEKRFFNTSVVNWALSEASSLFGLVLAMRLHGESVVLPFFLAGILMTLFHAPRITPLQPKLDRKELIRQRRRRG